MSDLVGNPEDRFSRVAAQFMVSNEFYELAPSDMLNKKPCLLSLSGQTISLKLKSPKTWTEGGGGVLPFI